MRRYGCCRSGLEEQYHEKEHTSGGNRSRQRVGRNTKGGGYKKRYSAKAEVGRVGLHNGGAKQRIRFRDSAAAAHAAAYAITVSQLESAYEEPVCEHSSASQGSPAASPMVIEVPVSADNICMLFINPQCALLCTCLF